MTLFQTSVLKKSIDKQDNSVVEKAYKRYKKYFFNPERQENIRQIKEEGFQQKFLMELFVNVLGYIINPDPNYNLTTEFKNQTGAKKADGAILVDGKALAVIELKSTKTKDLEQIRQQAFDYKSNQADCVYVITSNFERLRFYINNSVDFEEFDLFNITEKQFELFYLCLAKESLTENIPLQTKEASVIQEEKVTKQLYADYSLFKREIYRDIVKQNFKNPQLRELTDKNIKKTLFKKTQKLLDRFLFVFFAEDRDLLPPNSISQIIDKWQDDVDFGDDRKLYDIYKKYFHVLDVGRAKSGKRQEIFAYNGGLFKPDAILDSLIIDNDLLLKHTKKLTKYDFETDVDVNILGHIFENSLNEIESINAEIEGVEFDKQKTKRKKDGVFYTPKYITKYIVDNTIGKLCDEKKKELEINDEVYLYAKQRSKKRIDNIEAYRNWLLQLTICDPACGSGAFLNQALDFLIKEHAYIDQLTAKYHNVPMVLSDIENSILENNIYGVDLNEESVEIAKLSLWLRTAQKGRKLTSLSSNIKCGNSLIDSKAVAGDKAFKWEEEFPEVFANGGFDVILGNPPYLRVQGLRENFEKESKFYENQFKSATGRFDVYVLFMEKSFELINPKGLISFILPHKFLVSDFGIGIRQYFIDNCAVESIVHFGSEMVFEDASTYTCIINLSNNNKVIRFRHINPNEIFNNFKFEINKYTDLSCEKWNLKSEIIENLFNKLNSQPNRVEDIFSAIRTGVDTGTDDLFILQGKIKGDLFYGKSERLGSEVEIESSAVKPLLKGKDARKYNSIKHDHYVIYPHKSSGSKTVPYEEDEFIKKFPKTYEYLLSYKEELYKKKIHKKTNPKYWYSLHRARELTIFEQEKIVTPETSLGGNMTMDYDNYFHNTQVYSLIKKDEVKEEYKFWLSILNSNLFWFYLQQTGAVLRGGYFRFKTKYLEPFPLPKLDEINKQNVFVEKVEKIMSFTKDFTTIKDKFNKYYKSQFKIEKLSKKLENWHELEFTDFIKELNKAIKKEGGEKLSKTDEFDWMELFENKKTEAQALITEIDKTDKEIDRMVYDLYNLTEEEIKIVEGAV
jgi:type I restriction-modification system DNA methylase subunit